MAFILNWRQAADVISRQNERESSEGGGASCGASALKTSASKREWCRRPGYGVDV
jgi:hypothetical protein